MTSVCFYFQVHQPNRLKNFPFFLIGADHQYEAVDVNFNILNRVADKCYLPANNKILELIEKTGGKFKAAFSITGTALEQMEAFRPDVIASFQALAKTGNVEFLAETYYHSLAFLYSEAEFERQVKMHADKIKKLFGKAPVTFRNTELIYSNKVAAAAHKLGYKTILAEGVERNLGTQLPNSVFHAQGTQDINVLLRHYRLSDDIAFRFSDKNWSEYPLLAPRYASWLQGLKKESDTINLFLDYETFGEHRQAETGIFQFLTYLPAEILKDKDFNFATPAEVSDAYKPKHTYSAPTITTWADENRDITGWIDNHMQKDSLSKVYALEPFVLAKKDPHLTDIWAKLQTSDHFYYMSTKYWEDGVRQAFSPYKSPYDAYINYMNVLSDFEELVNPKPVAKGVADSKIAPEITTSNAPSVEVPKTKKVADKFAVTPIEPVSEPAKPVATKAGTKKAVAADKKEKAAEAPAVKKTGTKK